MGIVVQHGPQLHVRPKLCLTLSVQSLVEVHLTIVKGILPQQHRPAQASETVSGILLKGASLAKQGRSYAMNYNLVTGIRKIALGQSEAQHAGREAARAHPDNAS